MNIFHHSKINFHIDVMINIHQRFFEATLSGGFVLMPEHPDDSRKYGMGYYFEKGVEYDSFRDHPHLIEQLDRYLVDGELRRGMTKRAQEKIRRGHTYRNRAETILQTLLSSRTNPA